MKKIFIVLAMLPLMFSCGSDDDDNKEDELYYLQVITKYDSGSEAPEGYVHVFYLDNAYPAESRAYFSGADVCYMKDVNGEYIRPVYSKKLTKDKDLSTGLYKNTSTHAVYPNDLSSIYGTPDPKGKYLIAIGVFRPTGPSESGHSYTWKETDFKATRIEKTFKLYPNKDEMSVLGVYNDAW